VKRLTKNGPRLTAAIACSAVICGALVPAASARNLPKAEPPPKVVACDGPGDGFVRVEGSDTCVKLDGSVRAEVVHIGGGGSLSPSGR